jgi:phosphonate transport system substrate-binding protein
MKLRKLFALLAVLALVAAACGDSASDDTTTTAPPEDSTTTEAPMVDIGTADNPIQVLFVPSVNAEEIIAGGQLLKETLEEATGLVFEVSVPTSYAATVEEMCASPDNTIGFIPAQAYVLASELCDVEVSLKSLRFGYTEYWTQFIVPRDSDIQSLEDLAGKSWAYPDAGSTSGLLVPRGLLTSLGIEPGESFEAGGHGATARAVYNGEADFGTTFFSPAIDADGNPVWDGTSEDADVPNPEECAIVTADTATGAFGEGDLVCGDREVRDARRDIREEAPDVIQQVRILALSDPIPNDTMSFGPDFPEDVKQQIIGALTAFAADDPDGFATAFDAYSWDDVAPTSDSEFDFVRGLVQELGIEIGDL